MKRHRLIVVALACLISFGAIARLGLSASGSGRAEEAPPLLEYPEFPPTPTVAPAPAGRPNVAGAPLTVAGFDSPDALASWQIVDPADLQPVDRSFWGVEDGALVQNRTAAAGDPNTYETMALTGDPAWTNYTVSASAYDQSNATFGLVARRQGNSFYRYRIIADQFEATPKQVLEKVVDGIATPLVAHDGPGYARRQWHTIAMSVAGPNIRVTLDGTLVAEASDTSLVAGQAGLYTRALGGIRFDDVTVTAP
jgi:hypothetical protein